MKPLFFNPDTAYQNFVVQGVGKKHDEEGIPSGTVIAVTVDSTGTSADMVHVMPEGEVIMFDDCDIQGATISWMKEDKLLLGYLYEHKGDRYLVGFTHYPEVGPCPVEDWVATDKGR